MLTELVYQIHCENGRTLYEIHCHNISDYISTLCNDLTAGTIIIMLYFAIIFI